MRAALAIASVALAGIATLWAATDGLGAFTSEAARKLAVSENPVRVPETTLRDHLGRPVTLRAQPGGTLLVEFIYSRCRSRCLVASARFRDLQAALGADSDAAGVELLSVSFDLKHDKTEQLSAYAERFGADGARWRFASAANQPQLDQLLDAFGLVVIPDGRGDFQHNGGIHVVDDRGRLTAILEDDAAYEDVIRTAAL